MLGHWTCPKLAFGPTAPVEQTMVRSFAADVPPGRFNGLLRLDTPLDHSLLVVELREQLWMNQGTK